MLAAHLDADDVARVIAIQGKDLTLTITSQTQPPERLWTAEQPGDIQSVVIKSDGTEAAISLRSGDRWSIRMLDMQTGHLLAEISCPPPVQVLFQRAQRASDLRR